MCLLSFYFLNFFPQNLLLLQPERSHLLSIKSEKDTASINNFFYLKEIYGYILRYLISIRSYLYVSIFSGIQSA